MWLVEFSGRSFVCVVIIFYSGRPSAGLKYSSGPVLENRDMRGYRPIRDQIPLHGYDRVRMLGRV
ncbi:MAG: hypothetical protein DCC65_00110 [Planctomycetota bacterium]|nr:MAG: hypothetical protein DCC65_00110 [Planctomycetota bacterium]